MGEVYRATDLTLSQQVAFKFLPAEIARDPKFLARFNNEVRIARQVSHPNVCSLVFHGFWFVLVNRRWSARVEPSPSAYREDLFRGAPQISATRVYRQVDLPEGKRRAT